MLRDLTQLKFTPAGLKSRKGILVISCENERNRLNKEQDSMQNHAGFVTPAWRTTQNYNRWSCS